MKNKRSVIQELSFSGVLTSLAILLGAFAHFPLLGGNVYLVGVVVFLMPLLLRAQFAIICTIVSIVMTDLITGWIQFTWISIIAYTAATIVIFLFTILKFKFFYILGLVIASILASIIYYFLEWKTFDHASAVSDLIATLLQFSIVVPIVILIYSPIRRIIYKS